MCSVLLFVGDEFGGAGGGLLDDDLGDCFGGWHESPSLSSGAVAPMSPMCDVRLCVLLTGLRAGQMSEAQSVRELGDLLG